MIDGANRFQRIIHVDLPAIVPTIITMLIFNCASIMNIGFDKVYLMQNDMIALRAVMRLGWEIPNPINALAKDKTKRCPFAILKAGE